MRAKKGLEHFLSNDKNIAIFGLGVSGLSALKLLSSKYSHLKDRIHVVNAGKVGDWATPQILNYVDEKNCHSEDHPDTSQFLSICSLIILSPGIPRNHKTLEKAQLFNVPLWSEIELGFYFVSCPIIAVTGSNGKTTTVTMIGDIFKQAQKRVFIGGNIGIPLCDYALLDEVADCVVLELSSFQLESITEFKADIALILNLSLNHGERYPALHTYGLAKWSITNKMTWKDFLVFDEDNSFLLNKSKEQLFSTWGVKTSRTLDLKNILHKKYNLSQFKLIGEHNISNLFFATKAVELYVERFLPAEENIFKEAIQKTINSFEGVPHRVQLVPHAKNYLAFDDAKSTNWEATLTAINAVKTQKSPLWLILGGRPRGRGEDMAEFLEDIKNKVERILCFGECSNFVEEQVFDKFPLRKFRILDDLIKYVNQENFSGTLLFSPAFPSFDLYKNYEERGKHFVSLLSKN